MKDTRDVVACVVDHGLFVELALRLARDFKRVYYYTPWEKGFPMLNDCIVGDGFAEIIRVESPFAVLNDTDLFVFPDIQHAPLQLHLESIGKAVWGSREGDILELSRTQFMRALEDLGLDVPPHRVFIGITDLAKHLQKATDQWVKISRYRGMMESWHWIDWDTSHLYLDTLAVRFGAMKEHVPFLVFDDIPADVEWGYDGYNIQGKYPDLSAQGVEVKDKAYIAAMTDYDELPEQVRDVNEAFAPVLREYRYTNFWSTEIRIADDKSYFIDPCCRCPSPATECQMELYGNLGDIVWQGANNVCINPTPTAKFAVEAFINHHGSEKDWRVLRVTDEIRRWVKLYQACKVDGLYAIPPFPESDKSIGAVLGIGDTLDDAIDHFKANVEALGDAPVTVHTEALVDALKEIHAAADEGVELTQDKVPEPETVIQE